MVNTYKKGSTAIILLLIGIAISISFFGYKNVYKPYEIRKEFADREPESLKMLESFINSEAMRFQIIVPKYIPDGFYLEPFMDLLKDGEGFYFNYVNQDGVTLEVREDLFDDNGKEKSIQFQKNNIRNKEIQINNNVTVYTSRIPVHEENTNLPIGNRPEVTLRSGSADYIFFLDNLRIKVSSEVLGDGELLDDSEMIKVVNSMIR